MTPRRDEFSHQVVASLCAISFLSALSPALSYAQETNPVVGEGVRLCLFSLDQAIERALEHNEGILAAEAQLKATDVGVAVARSGFFPTITAQGSYTRLADLPSLGMPEYGMMQVPVFGPMGDTIGFTIVPGIIGATDFKMGNEENYTARLSLQQPLFMWGKAWNGYQMAKLNAGAAKEDYRKTRNELLFDVTKAFYGILVLTEFVTLTEDAYWQVEKHVEAVKERYDQGLASEFDLLRARVELSNMEPQVVKVRNGLETARTGFKILLGLPQDAGIELKGELDYQPVSIDLDESIEKARVSRPEARALLLRKQMARKALALARKANLPNMVFIANYDYKKPLYFDNQWGEDWNMTASLQMPIFTGLSNIGRVKQAKSRLSQAEHGLKLLQEGVEMEVRTAYLALREAERLSISQEKNVAQAEKALEIAKRRYKTGLATSLEVMDTQLSLTRARTNQLQALSDCMVGRAALERATGM
jgi:outer membrane protein TolC